MCQLKKVRSPGIHADDCRFETCGDAVPGHSFNDCHFKFLLEQPRLAISGVHDVEKKV